MSSKGHVPIRMCIFCRKRFPKDLLKRFVFKKGMIVEDENKTLSGRGAYCCTSPECLKKLTKYGHKALKGALKLGN